jgi:hypothetical protein
MVSVGRREMLHAFFMDLIKKHMEQNLLNKMKLFLTCDRKASANEPAERIYISINGNPPEFKNDEGKWVKGNADQAGQYCWETNLRTLMFTDDSIRMIQPGTCQELRVVLTV